MVPVRVWTAVFGLLLLFAGCGLDGISGQLLRIEQNLYFVKTPGGNA